jgi:hypothetical protein
MMRAVIRNGSESLHLIGHVDPYNLESLRDHTTSMAGHGQLFLTIDVSPNDKARLDQHAGRWLARLSQTGAHVVVRKTPLAAI